MEARKIKKIKDLLENAIKKAKFGLEREGKDTQTEEFQERVESLKSAILKKAGVTKEEYELAERFFDTELDLLRTKIRIGKLETKKPKWGEIDEKPEIKEFRQDQIKDLEFSQLKHKDGDHAGIVGNILDLREEDRALAERIQQTKEDLKTKTMPQLRHGELLAIGKDDHHPEEHNLESHADSDWKDKFKRLIGGQRVDDLHTHAFPLDKPWVGDPWGVTKGDTDVWYLHLDGTNSPSANINWGGFKITNLADPTADQDAATKAYVDAQITGENWWDRIGTVLSPHHSGDTISVGGATLAGQLDFTGTTHAGVKLNSLTTTQMNALTPENGMIVYNTTDNKIEGYINGAWGNVGVTDHSQLSNLSYASAGHTGFEPTVTKGNLTTTTTGLAITGGTGAVIGLGATINADTGYGMPTTAKMSNWDTAYGWGNHAGLYLGLHAKADDSDLLDGHDTSYFQIAGSYQPLDADLSAIAALGFASTSFLKKTAADTWALDTNTYLTSVTVHNLLSATHGDTVSASPVLGDILYGDATPNWKKLAGNTTTTKKYLSQTGTGAISAVPSWAQIAITDLASFTSANLAGVISDETGSGSLVFATSPTLVTPTLGAATATSINSLTLTSLAVGFSIAGGTTPKTLTVDETASLSGKANTALSNLGTTSINANLLPAADSSYSLGTFGNYWSYCFADNVYLNSSAYFNGTYAGIFTTFGSFRNTTDYNGLVITANTGVITTGTWNATIITGQYGGTGIANTGKTITLGGNFVTSGAYACTLTLTNTTNVTLPTTGTLATLVGVETFTNKRITFRTGTTPSSATPTINTDNVEFYSLTAQAVNITSFTTNLSGTPTERQTLWIAITGTAARTIAWGTSFEASTVALPTTTVTTNRLDVGFIWNTVTSKWRCIATA